MGVPRIEASQQVHIKRIECAGRDVTTVCGERDFATKYSAEGTSSAEALRNLEKVIKRECAGSGFPRIRAAKVCELQGQPAIKTLPSRGRVSQFLHDVWVWGLTPIGEK